VNRAVSVDGVQTGLKEVQERLNAQKKLLKGCNHEIGAAHAEKSQLVKDMSNVQLQVQELEHKVSKCNKDTNDAAKLVHVCCDFAEFVTVIIIMCELFRVKVFYVKNVLGIIVRICSLV